MNMDTKCIRRSAWLFSLAMFAVALALPSSSFAQGDPIEGKWAYAWAESEEPGVEAEGRDTEATMLIAPEGSGFVVTVDRLAKDPFTDDNFPSDCYGTAHMSPAGRQVATVTKTAEGTYEGTMVIDRHCVKEHEGEPSDPIPAGLQATLTIEVEGTGEYRFMDIDVFWTYTDGEDEFTAGSNKGSSLTNQPSPPAPPPEIEKTIPGSKPKAEEKKSAKIKTKRTGAKGKIKVKIKTHKDTGLQDYSYSIAGVIKTAKTNCTSRVVFAKNRNTKRATETLKPNGSGSYSLDPNKEYESIVEEKRKWPDVQAMHFGKVYANNLDYAKPAKKWCKGKMNLVVKETRIHEITGDIDHTYLNTGSIKIG